MCRRYECEKKKIDQQQRHGYIWITLYPIFLIIFEVPKYFDRQMQNLWCRERVNQA